MACCCGETYVCGNCVPSSLSGTNASSVGAISVAVDLTFSATCGGTVKSATLSQTIELRSYNFTPILGFPAGPECRWMRTANNSGDVWDIASSVPAPFCSLDILIGIAGSGSSCDIATRVFTNIHTAGVSGAFTSCVPRLGGCWAGFPLLNLPANWIPSNVSFPTCASSTCLSGIVISGTYTTPGVISNWIYNPLKTPDVVATGSITIL